MGLIVGRPTIGGGWESQMGGRGRGGAYAPPGLDDLDYWFDASDLSTLYSDDEATTAIAATDETVVRAIKSKGQIADAAVTGVADTDVVLETAWYFQKHTVHFETQDASTMDVETSATVAASGSFTMLWVGDVDTATTDTTYPAWIIDADSASLTGMAIETNGLIDVVVDGNSKEIPNSTLSNGDKFAVILTYDVNTTEIGGYASNTSNVFTGTDSFASLPFAGFSTGDNVSIHAQGHPGNLAEWMVWDGVQDVSRIKSFVTDKWGIAWT